MNPENISGVHELTHLVGDWTELILPIFALFLLRSFIERIVYGIFWRIKNPYEEDEIVYIDGKWACITNIGWIKTKLTVYVWNDDSDKPSGGLIWSIDNKHLSELHIMRLKERLNVHEVLKMKFQPGTEK